MQRTENVFYHKPAQIPRVIDGTFLGDDGIERGVYSGETLEQIAARYPGAQHCHMSEFMAMHEAAWRTAPEECSRGDFLDALEILPPLGYHRAVGFECFKMIERTSGNMTLIYARVGDRYFTFTDKDSMTPNEIFTRVMEVLK